MVPKGERGKRRAMISPLDENDLAL